MARMIGIYNNKGGVGKTTLALFLADFLSSVTIKGKKSRVLVIDFDPQASCCNAILGPEKVAGLRETGKTLPHALKERAEGKNGPDLLGYIFTRKENLRSKTKKTRLGNLDVIVSEAELALAFEESASMEHVADMASWIKTSLSEHYDFIFIDLPGSLSKRNGFSLIGAFLADYFLVPIEPNRMNINAIPLTLKMLNDIRGWRGNKRPFRLLGFVLNKADRRTRQYKLHKDALVHYADVASCKIYDNILPPTPKLSNATDDSIQFITLSDRYDTYYAHVKKLVLEVIDDLGFSVKPRQEKS
ncbi:chromosome partitioning protein [Desulfobotulus alkaliphilus]|uniref:Chromosome partitioning protein n=1 Tax=Desulfobotulus alkaliphilus TaxID=622671 RepID=A0A562S2J0_9BACT|nr:ParA family protein [Desulfobotulus alkaliphilus]TWI75597.1 chromosome partitioning protein [Desulfobotulus alkaliphilus]